MKETGIIMSGDHPLKCLDGTKTMTRRTWGLEIINKNPDEWFYSEGSSPPGRFTFFNKQDNSIVTVKCPYGGVGDRLWMRETWMPLTHTIGIDKALIFYKADGQKWWVKCSEEEWDKVYYQSNQRPDVWRPSIHMPRWASRGLFEITALRAERLQEITDEEIELEGIRVPDLPGSENLRHRFSRLWDSLNAKRGYGWEFNPWVWPIGFQKL